MNYHNQYKNGSGLAWCAASMGAAVTLGEALNMIGDLQTARKLLEEGLTLAREQDEQQAIGWGLIHLGYNVLLQNDLIGAQACYQESAAIFEALGPHKSGLGWAHFGLGEAALAKDDASAAIKNLKTAVKYFNQYKNRLGIAWCISSLAGAISLQNQYKQVARLWSMVEAIHDYKGAREAPIIKSLHEKLRENVRSHLGEGNFKALVSEKQSSSLEQAVNEAMAL